MHKRPFVSHVAEATNCTRDHRRRLWTKLIALALLATALTMVVHPYSSGQTLSTDSQPQLFPNERFFEEPDFFRSDLEQLLASRPGRLDRVLVSCGGQPCTAADAVYNAGNTYQYSVNVGLLLTVLELHSGLVTGDEPSPELIDRPLGLDEPVGFEEQLHWLTRSLVETFWSYAPGAVIHFSDGSDYPVPPATSAASYAVMAILAELTHDRTSWEDQVEPERGAFANTFADLSPVAESPVFPQQQFPGNGDPAFVHRPYQGGTVGTNSFFDHEYPDRVQDGTIVIYTGERRTHANLNECIIGYSCYAGHPAYDYGCNGRSVVAAADGVIDTVYVNYWEPGWQTWCSVGYTPVNAMIVQHDPDGDNQYEFKTRYWHMASIANNPATGQLWKAGDPIAKGSVIGPTGSTGCSTGPHLHFAMTRSGRAFDPYGWGDSDADPWDPNFWLWANADASYAAETMDINSPADGDLVQGTVTVSGWAINRLYGPDSGVDQVVVYLDDEARAGQYLGSAVYGDYRPDVGSLYGDTRFDYSGYHFIWDTSGLMPGEHTLYVYARSVKNNNWFFHQRTVTVEPGDSTPPIPPAIIAPTGPNWYQSFARVQKPTFTWEPAQEPDGEIARTCARVYREPGHTLGAEKCWTTDPQHWTVPVTLGEGSHRLVVTATNGAGLSASDSFNFAVDTTAPTLPSGIDAGCSAHNNQWQSTCNDPDFTWSGASDGSGCGVKDYHLYWGDSEQGAPSFYQPESSYDPDPFTPPGSCATHFLNMAVQDNLLQETVAGPAFVIRYDDIPPAGATLLIDGGAETTNQVTVRLDVSASEPEDCSGLAEMRLSNDQDAWTGWLPYQVTTLWAIPALNRSWHTVHVEVRDDADNVASAQDSIFLDLYPEKPHSQSYRICADVLDVGGQSKASASYWMFGAVGQPISGSGLEGLTYQGADGLLGTMGGCPVNWAFATSNTLTHQAASTSGQFVASGKASAASPSYQIWSGSWPGSTGPALEVPQYPPPPPFLPEDEIFGVQAGKPGLNFVNQITTTLRLWAPAVEQVQLSKEPEFLTATWQTFVPTLTWYYAPDPEIITSTRIFARFRDGTGTVYGDYETSVFYDGVPPVGTAKILDIYQGVTTVGLYATDDNSGVGDVRLALEPGFASATWQAYTATLTTTLPVENLLYAQFRDRAGNVCDLTVAWLAYPTYLPLVVGSW